jgi:hypothetical protein
MNMKIEPFFRSRSKWYLLEVTKRLKAITKPIRLIGDWQDTHFTTTGFGVETKKETIDVNQCLMT